MTVCHHIKPLTLCGLPYEELAKSVRGSKKNPLAAVEGTLARLRKEPGWLSVEDLVSVARPGRDGLYRRVELDEGWRARVNAAREEVQEYLSEDIGKRGGKGRRIYGVNTGFGSARKFQLDRQDSPKLSANMLYSHATSVGRPLPVEIVRAMMVLRIRTFIQGNSGVRWEILETLKDMLNRGVVPYVPSKGSVGCSGDLSTLAHLFLVLIGAGKAWVIQNRKWDLGESWNDDIDCREVCDSDFVHAQTRLEGNPKAVAAKKLEKNPYALLTGAEAMAFCGIGTLALEAKESLAVTNGASFSTSALALGVFDAERFFHCANIAGSLTHQAVSGHTRAFEAVVNAVRPHPGQILAGWELIRLLKGGNLVNRAAFVEESQDDYSVRSMPQVHGASWDAIAQARRVAEIELNSTTDNPLFFRSFKGEKENEESFKKNLFETDGRDFPSALTRKTLDTTHCSAANFHGQPIAIALDLLKIALAELANIAERRIQLLLDADHNRGLPANLSLGAQGLHSGFMLMQYTAAALVSENKVLCHPSSVDSIPTSANAEDHVSMSANAARHLRQVAQNVADVLAIEAICGLQALDIRTRLIGLLVRQEMMVERIREQKKGVSQSKKSVGWFIHEKYGGKAMILFPKWALWRSKQKHPKIDEMKSIEKTDLPKTEPDWLDTSELAIAGSARAVWNLLRDETGSYKIPVIHHDGELGKWDAECATIWSGQNLKSFKECPPGWMIRSVSRAIRSGDLLRAVWPS